MFSFVVIGIPCSGPNICDRVSDSRTQIFTLTPEQHDAFKRAGILRLDGLLPAEGVRQAREAVLRRTTGQQHGTESDQVLARKAIRSYIASRIWKAQKEIRAILRNHGHRHQEAQSCRGSP